MSTERPVPASVPGRRESALAVLRVKLVAKLIGLALLASTGGCASAVDQIDVRDSIKQWSASPEQAVVDED